MHYAKTKAQNTCAVATCTADQRLCFRYVDNTLPFCLSFFERGGLVVNASDSGSRGRGFVPHLGQTVLCP